MRGVALSLLLLASCAPDYGHSAFLCDERHPCPTGQLCHDGRCRRGLPTGTGIACGSATCPAGDQCCLYDESGPQCIRARDVCPDVGALCDTRDDCNSDDRCCADGDLHSCDATCSTYACTTDADCPSIKPVCCPSFDTPWGTCATSC